MAFRYDRSPNGDGGSQVGQRCGTAPGLSSSGPDTYVCCCSNTTCVAVCPSRCHYSSSRNLHLLWLARGNYVVQSCCHAMSPHCGMPHLAAHAAVWLLACLFLLLCHLDLTLWQTRRVGCRATTAPRCKGAAVPRAARGRAGPGARGALWQPRRPPGWADRRRPSGRA